MKIRTARSTALLTITVMTSSVAIAKSDFKFTDRNEHNYTLMLDDFSFINGGWTGDANLTISECPQKTCFHLSGPVKLPLTNGNNEGYFAVTGLPCELHIVEVPRTVNGYSMDSGNWRVTFVSRSQDGKGCASLPPGLTGFYQQE